MRDNGQYAGGPSRGPEALIELRSVSKSFGTYRAVDDVSMTIADGEFVTLLGASGSGKTTTLRLIAGLEMPSSGSIWFERRDITDVPPTHRNMRMVFQDYALFPHLSVEDNVRFGLTVSSMKGRFSQAEIPKRVARYLDIVQLSGHARKMPHQLSGGQKQRVALARALITDPKVVLFDEPLGSLDASLRKLMQIELKRMHREFQMTFIYVTHDQEEAMAMSDKVAVLQNARLLQFGTPAEIYDAPRSRAVAEFIGAANVLQGKVTRSNGSALSVKLEGGEELSCAMPEIPLGPGQAAMVMLRAERFVLGDDMQAVPNNRLKGVVAERLYLGKSVEYVVSLPGQQRAIHVIDSSQSVAALAVGAPIEMTMRPEHIRVLTDAP